MKRQQNTIYNIYPLVFGIILLMIWQGVVVFGLVPRFLLPTPVDIGKALLGEWRILFLGAITTFGEAMLGLSISIVLGGIMAILMNEFFVCYQTLYPFLIISQTIPTIALAPLLVLWLGYGMAPKIVLVVIVCFFPITMALLQGIRNIDSDILHMMDSFGANRLQTLWHVRLPFALPSFFAGLKIALSYSIIGAVIAEWLGGNSGLGVYMIRVKKMFAYDKMFAAIIVVMVVSLLLMKGGMALEKKVSRFGSTSPSNNSN